MSSERVERWRRVLPRIVAFSILVLLPIVLVSNLAVQVFGLPDYASYVIILVLVVVADGVTRRLGWLHPLVPGGRDGDED